MAREASGCIHHYFRHPGGDIGNRAGVLPKVDVRAQGGYVVAPPSLHVSGKRYTWSLTPREVGFADAPAWLLELLQQPNGGHSKRSPEEWRSLAAEGVGEGARHSSLCAISGKVFASDLDPTVGCQLLHAWNEARCRPPLPHAEAAKVILDIRDREAAKASSGAVGGDFFDLALTRRLAR